MQNIKSCVRALPAIVIGSLIYAFSVQYFIFSNNLFLGGTSGVSVILNHFFPGFSSGEFLMIINIALMVLALVILGRDMALKTFIGSTLTTLFVGMFEKAAAGGALIANPILSAVAGSALIALASAVLFYVDSSSGGTDIIALIIRKYSSVPIGAALMIADVLIVVIGACVSPLMIAIASVVGLIVKTRGVDLILPLIRRIFEKQNH